MFSGIVESVQPVLQATDKGDSLQIQVQCPPEFNDLNRGDSISFNGVCLTVEEFDDKVIHFTLGRETLNITGWSVSSLTGTSANLERSLRLGDRIHGHLVSGHVDSQAEVISIEPGESWVLDFHLKNFQGTWIWHKGSVTLHGVSLTVNRLEKGRVQVCLIPETLQRTNLKDLKVGDLVNVEYDLWAKAIANYQEQRAAQVES